jgi:hypothetical protein
MFADVEGLVMFGDLLVMRYAKEGAGTSGTI